MKNKLINFIQRYNVDDMVKAVSVTSKDKTLSTKFISDDNQVMGQVNEYGIDIDEGTICIRDTDQLLRMLHILNDDINIDLIGEADQYTSLALSDGNIKANFLLCDPSIIVHKEARFSDPGMIFHLTSAFCNNFVKAYSALIDNEFFTIEPDGQENVKVIVGPHKRNGQVQMNVTLTTPVDSMDDFLMDSVKMRSGVFKDIIIANKDFEQGVVHVIESHAIKISFHKPDGFSSQYYLPAVQQDEND
mgnify:CR=1 FL=1